MGALGNEAESVRKPKLAQVCRDGVLQVDQFELAAAAAREIRCSHQRRKEPKIELAPVAAVYDDSRNSLLEMLDE